MSCLPAETETGQIGGGGGNACHHFLLSDRSNGRDRIADKTAVWLTIRLVRDPRRQCNASLRSVRNAGYNLGASRQSGLATDWGRPPEWQLSATTFGPTS